MKKGKSRQEKLTSQLHLTEQQIDFFTQESWRILGDIDTTREKITKEMCGDLCRVTNPSATLLEVADKFMFLLGYRDRSWSAFRVTPRQQLAHDFSSLKEAMSRLAPDELKEEQLTALLPVWKSQEQIHHKLQGSFAGAVILTEFIALSVEYKLKNETLATSSRKLPNLEKKLKSQQDELASLSHQIDFSERQILKLHRALLSSHEGSEVDERLTPDLTALSMGSTDLSKAVVIEERTIGVAPFREGTASGGIMKTVSPKHSVMPQGELFPNFEGDLYRDRPPSQESSFEIAYEDSPSVSHLCGSVFIEDEEKGLECQHFERVSLTQTEEELREWSTSEDWAEGQKALGLLHRGFALQKRAVLTYIHRLAAEPEFTEIFQSILVPATQRDLPSWEEPLQVDAGTGFYTALSTRVLQGKFIPDLARVAMTLLATWSPPVHETWLPVFEQLVQQLALGDVESICVPVALTMGEPSQTVQTRTLACSLFAVLAEKMGSRFKGEIIYRVRLLSQDPSFEVRKRMALQLPRIAAAVDKNIRSQILEEVLKLLVDDEIEVSRLAVAHLSSLLPLFSTPSLAQVITSDLLQSTDKQIRLSLAQVSGLLLHNFADSAPLYDFYVSLTLDSTPTIQLAAAENFPLVFQAKIAPCSETELIAMFEGFAASKDEGVRIAVAKRFHEVIRVYRRPFALHHVLVDMLGDRVTRWVVVQNLAELFEGMKTEENKGFWTSIQSLLTPDQSWRNLSTLIHQIFRMRKHWKMSELLEYIQPSLMRLLQEGGWTLRLQCLDLLIALVYDNFYKVRRIETCVSFTNLFSKCPNFQGRILFIEFCDRIIKTHSKLFFETHFFRAFLQLYQDPIVSVRIRIAEVLPHIGKVFSGEEHWSSEVSEAVSHLSEDRDTEVRDRALAALKEMGQKEYWEAARGVEAEEVVKLARENEQDEREMAVIPSQEKEEEKKKVLQELTRKARTDYLVQYKEKNGSRSSSRSKAAGIKLSPAPARATPAAKAIRDKPNPAVPPSPKIGKVKGDTKMGKKK